jgi:hypothetical protein
MAKGKKSPTPKLASRHPLTLNAEQVAFLTEMATLVYYSDGFVYTRDMMRLTKLLADRAGPNFRRACLAAHAG